MLRILEAVLVLSCCRYGSRLWGQYTNPKYRLEVPQKILEYDGDATADDQEPVLELVLRITNNRQGHWFGSSS
jgi:hypothetical protein